MREKPQRAWMSRASQSRLEKSDGAVRQVFPAPGWSKTWPDARHRAGVFSCRIAKEFVREGDTLVITKTDRLARSTIHLWEIVRDLDAKGVGLRVLNLGGEVVDTGGATGPLILTIFAGFSQFEREMMRERERQGKGKYAGRKPSARAKSEDVLKLHREGKTPTQTAKAVGIGRGGVYRIIAGPAEMPRALSAQPSS